MWSYVVIEIEWTNTSILVSYACWNILYKAPIEYDELSSVRGPKDAEAFRGCEVWLEQNKNETSKYAIMKMFIV